MRIGIYLENYQSTAGGGYTYLSQLLDGFFDSYRGEHEFVLLYWDKNADPASFAQVEKICLTDRYRTQRRSKAALGRAILGKLKNKNGKAPDQALVDRVVQDAGIDLLWYPTPSFLTLEVPFIATVWDLEFRRAPSFPEVSQRGEWQRREELYSAMLRRAEFVTTGTLVGKELICRYYQVESARVRVLPFFTPDVSSKNSPAASVVQAPYLLYPAQFWAHKNHVALLRALKIVREKTKLPLSLVFCGSDHGNEAYVRSVVAELELEDAVHFLGFVSRPELVNLYRRASALAFASLLGPDNLPPLEAFALGCPVIAHRSEGSVEQLGDAAMLVDATDERDFANAIIRILEDSSLRASLIEKGSARARAITPQRTREGIFALFEEFSRIRRCWAPAREPSRTPKR